MMAAQSNRPLRANAVDPMIGRVINGRYRVLSALATGGMGKIYRAEQMPLGRLVAFKTLNARPASSEEIDASFQKRFLLEASTLARLQHPNLITVFDYGRIESEDAYFMAMELLEGDTLQQRLKRGAMPLDEVLAISRQMARGLRDAHKHGIVHRDLKPSNVILVPQEDGGEIVKILDFGIAKVVGEVESVDITQEGVFMGSPRYISPEQVIGSKIDARTDVYSFGVILYEMLCGARPFENEQSMQLLMAHVRDAVPPMSERSNVVVPEPLEALARLCLAKKPSDRPASMEDLNARLRECAVTLGLSMGDAVTGEQSGSRLRPPGGNANDSVVPTAFAAADEPGPELTEEGDTGPLRAAAAARAPVQRRSWPLVVGAMVAMAAAGAVYFRGEISARIAGVPTATATATAVAQPAAPASIAEPQTAPVAHATHAIVTPSGSAAAMVTIRSVPAGALVRDGTTGETLCTATPCVIGVSAARRVTVAMGDSVGQAVLDPAIASVTIPMESPAAAAIRARPRAAAPAPRVAGGRARPASAGRPSRGGDVPMFGTGTNGDGVPMFGSQP